MASHDHKITAFQVERALAALNGINLTIGQLERGFAAWLKGGQSQEGRRHVRDQSEVRFAALVAFARNEGFVLPELAAEAILLRFSPAIQALGEGIDLKTSDPEGYRELANTPITRKAVSRVLEAKQRDHDHSVGTYFHPLNDNWLRPE